MVTHVLEGRLSFGFEIADMLAPEENNQNFNYALLDFGALVCRYGIPKCKACPIKKICDYYLLGNPFTG